MRAWMMVGIATATGLAATGCMERSKLYCCLTEETCNEEGGAGRIIECTDPSRPFCDDLGQYPASEGIRHTCIPDPFGDGGMPDAGTDGGSDCETSAECTAPTAPICSPGGTCAACESGATGDADCAAKDSATPRCASTGACVACLDSGDCPTPSAPVCDSATNTCRACDDHAECASEVCDDSTGACVANGNIVYVATAGANGGACGTSADPCLTIGGGGGALAKVTATRKWIKVRSGVYAESVTANAITVNFIGEAGSVVAPPVTSNTPGLLVTGAATVLVDGLTFQNATGGANADGIRCTDAAETPVLRLTRVRVADNEAQGIQTSSCTLTVERSSVAGNNGGGLSLADSSFTIRNNFITGNGEAGASGSPIGGVFINNGAAQSPQVFEFNTVADSRAHSAAAAAGANCFTTTSMTATNNIVFLRTGGAAMLSGSCSWTYSDIEGGQTGTGNIDMDPQFVNAVSGDFHIGPTSPCRDAADPDATEPLDFDGDARGEGGRSDMGADEVTP